MADQYMTPEDFNNESLVPDIPLMGAVLEQAMQVNPDQQAKDMKLSRVSGLPIDAVKTDAAQVDRQVRMQQFDFNTFGQKNPVTEAFYSDLAKASLAHDDVHNLSGMERVLTPLASISSAALSMEEGALRIPQFAEDVAKLTSQNIESFGIPRAINPVRGLETIASGYRMIAAPWASQFHEAQAELPNISDSFKRLNEINQQGDVAFDVALKGDFKPLMGVLTDPEAVTSYAANALPSLLIALASGGSLPIVMGMEGSSELISQADYTKKHGEIPLEKRVQATMQTAIISGMLEKVGIDYLRKFPAFSKFFKEADTSGVKVADIFKTAGAEAGTEAAQQFNQNIAQVLSYDPTQSLTSGVLQSAIGGMGGGGVAAGTGYAAGKVYEKAERAAFDPKTQVNEGEQSVIDKMNHYATQSATRTRDPETFREFVQGVNKDADVYIDGEAAAKYMQPKSAEEIAADPALQLLKSKLEGSEPGTDIAVPVADFATDIAGTSHYDSLREHMKLDPESSTPAQQVKAEAEMQGFVERTMSEAQQHASTYAESQDIFTTVRDQLIDTGRVTAQQAGVMADIVPAWATVQAQSRGIPVAQVYAESGLKIEGPMTGKMDELSTPSFMQAVQKQTETPEFKNWFAGSKMVDADGKPLVMYHGTDANFTEFEQKSGTISTVFGSEPVDRQGFFFTPDKDMAATFGKNVVPVHLSVRKLFDVRAGITEQMASDMEAQGVTETYLTNGDFWEKLDGQSGSEFVKALKAAGYDGIAFNEPSAAGQSGGDAFVAFNPTQIKSAIGNSGAYDPKNPNILMQPTSGEVNTESEAFKKWSGGGEIVEPEDVNGYKFTQGEPVVLKVFHGTTHEFSVFDATRGNLEGQFGAINYFTSSQSDANDNYAGEGPDLTSRIEQKAEQMVDDIQNVIDDEGVEMAKELYGEENYNEDTMEFARNIVRKELHGGEEKTMELFVKVERPFVIGTVVKQSYPTIVIENPQWIEFTDNAAIDSEAVARVADNNGVSVEKIEAKRDDYEDEIDEARWEIESETPNKLIEAIQTVADRYGVDASNLASQVYNLGSEATPAQIEALIRASDDSAYAEHPETGELIGNQIIQEVIKEMGFDSIILRDAGDRFKTMGIGSDVAHVHIFDADKTNIKSVQNIGTFDPSNPDIYHQTARGYYDPSQSLIRLTEASNLSTFLHEFAHFMYDMERKNPNSKMTEKIHQWFKRNAEDVAMEANGYAGMEGKPMEQAVQEPDRMTKLGDLPRDMREELFNEHATNLNPDATERGFYAKSVPSGLLRLSGVIVDSIPSEQLSHFEGAKLKDVPPIVIADGRLLDGQHRIQWARSQGYTSLRYIDVSGLIDTNAGGFISELPSDPNILMQPAQTQRFYSQLQKSIEAAPDRMFSTGKATSQWLTSNAAKLGVKKDELYWSGINEWLEAQGKVSKADVLSFLEQGGVKVDEVVLGESKDAEQAGRELAEADGNVWDELGTANQNRYIRKAAGVSQLDSVQGEPKFKDYQLPGGENYRELLLTLPNPSADRVSKLLTERDTIEAGYIQKGIDIPEAELPRWKAINKELADARAAKVQDFRSSHYDTPNILAHIRFNERTDADGKRVLFVEEIQSDWGQEGKKKGFGDQPAFDLINPDGSSLRKGFGTRKAAENYLAIAVKEGWDGGATIKEGKPYKGLPPSAPFITDTKSWTALALKRVISHAVENGFDSIAWTTGEQQSERYDLSKQVEEIAASPNGDGTYDLELTMPDGSTQNVRKIAEGDLEDQIGKDLAKKIIEDSAKWTEANKAYRDALKEEGIPEENLDELRDARDVVTLNYSGLDLQVGGEGMKGFYDAIVPQVANDILKKLGGGKVEQLKVSTGINTDDTEIHWTEDSDGIQHIEWDGNQREFKTEDEAKAFRDELKNAKTAQPGFTITPELRAKVQAEGLPLFQGPINKQQGSITAQHVVDYLDKGTSGDTAKDAAIERAVHEQFARGFEKYLMEGVAPSVELRNVFRTFARWLVQVYKSIKGDLQVNLDDDMRKVFARMLATDEQIAAAEARTRFEPMFTSAAMAGMTDEEFAKYQEKQSKVKDKATETLRDKLIKQLTRQTEAWWKSEKGDIILNEIEKLRGERVYAAADKLRNGEFKLDHGAVKEVYGTERTDKLGRKMTRIPDALIGMTVSGGEGVSIDDAAAFLGYGSGDEMVQDLMSAPPIKVKAEEIAEQEMIQRHGDIMTDGTIEREADEAVRNEERGEMILAELKALSKGTSRAAIDRAMLKSLAEDAIGKLSFREIQPGKYRAAELRAAQESAAALATGNKEGASSAKARQALNYYLGMAATAAKNDTMKIVDRMARYRKKDVKEAIMSAGNGYWGQLTKILDRFEFRKAATLKQVDEVNESLRTWMKARVEDDGDALVFSPAVLDEGYTNHWKNIAYNELVGISDSVKNLEHVARYSNKITRMQESMDFNKLVNRWVESIDTKSETKFVSQRTDVIEGKKWGRWAMAQMTKIPFMASWLDGGERVGISHDILVQPFTNAYNEEVQLWHSVGGVVMDAIQNRSKADIKRHNTKLFIKEIKDQNNDGNLFGHQVLAVALNTGNAGNLKKMLLGEGWATEGVDDTIDNPKLQAVLKHMTKSDWELVQLIWDQMDKLYPMLEEVHRRTTGLTPPKVEATAVKTPYGTLKGGYYPVKYDPNRSFRAEKNEDRLNAQTESMFGTMGIQASVNASATNERTGYFAPIRLSLDVVPSHFQETIHYITHHDAVRETNKLIRNESVATAIKSKLGPEEYAQLKPWLNDIAKDGREAPMKTYWGSILQRLRFGLTLGVMGFKASTGIMQLFGLTNTVSEVGSANMFQAVRSVLGTPNDMKDAWDFAAANSKVMNHRAETMDREIKNAMQKLEGKRGIMAAVQEASMKHIAMIQTYMVDLPSWHAAYIKGMKQWGDEARAYQYADWVVENIQGSGVTKDMAQIMRNQSQESRLFTMFMTFFSSLWNIERDMARGASSGVYSKTNVAAKLMFTFAIPVYVQMLLQGGFGDDDDDKESSYQKYLTQLALYPVQSIPFVRDIASATLGEYGYNISPLAQLLEQGTQSIPKLATAPFTDEEITKHQVKGAVKFIGAAAGVPGVNQAWATGEHLEDVMREGEDLTVRQLIYGPTKK